MMEFILEMIRGFATNLGITLFSAFLPLCVGIPLSLLAKKSSVAGKVFGWLKIPFECICIPIFIVLLFYVPGLVLGFGGSGDVVRVVSAILAMTMAYLLYIPSRYNQSYSFLKNTLYNSLGLISNLFKWSFIARGIAVVEALFVATGYVSRGILWPLIVTFIITGAVLLVIETARTLIKQFMK